MPLFEVSRMTTIAYDGKIIAADSRQICGDYTNPLNATKLVHMAGMLFGTSGVAGLCEPCVKWFLDGAKAEDMPKVQGEAYSFVVFRVDEPALYFHSNSPHRVYLGAPDAWGSGADFAIGAMLFGANAQEAVRVACKANSSHSAPPIISYRAENGVWLRNGDMFQ